MKPRRVVSLADLRAGVPAVVEAVNAALAAEGVSSYEEWQRSLSVPADGTPDFQSLRRLGAHAGFDVKEK